MVWRQDLGLGDDAVGEAVLPALCGNFCPGDLKACDSLVGQNPGNAPQEISSDVAVVDREGGCQVLRLGQHLGKTSGCLSRTGDVFMGLAPDGGTGRSKEGGALVLGASLRLEHVDGDFVLAGEQQAREVDVVLLGDRLLWSPSLVVTAVLWHPLDVIAAHQRVSSVLPVNADLQLAVLVEGRAHLQRACGTLPQGGNNR